jgi:hypothetical protein
MDRNVIKNCLEPSLLIATYSFKFQLHMRNLIKRLSGLLSSLNITLGFQPSSDNISEELEDKLICTEYRKYSCPLCYVLNLLESFAKFDECNHSFELVLQLILIHCIAQTQLIIRYCY